MASFTNPYTSVSWLNVEGWRGGLRRDAWRFETSKRSIRSIKKGPPGCLGCVGGSYPVIIIGIETRHCKDPYEPTSIMEYKRFFFVARMDQCG